MAGGGKRLTHATLC